jgi:endosialidase-like protein
MNTATRSLVTTLTLICFGFLPRLQAVSPPPDGGYPGANTAEGFNALFSLTTGLYNTAIGYFALDAVKTGNFNTALGAGALFANTGDENTATGAGALLSNTSGFSNTAIGESALFSNTTGAQNTAIGASALQTNATGDRNTATGESTLQNNTTGFSNTAIGEGALFQNTIGFSNTAIGHNALAGNITGVNNTAIGDSALFFSTGTKNTALGIGAGNGITTATNVICIGASVFGADVDNSCFIGNIRDVTTQNGDAIPVVIDSAGQLGTASSSQRFKKEIKPMDTASEAILNLKPVTFHYKTDKNDTPQFGLIAEEVAKVNPNLVVRDKNGEIYTVRYEAVNAMLLNEFLKEHQKVEDQDRKLKEQQATIAQLRKDLQATGAQQQEEIEALTAGLQKVSAQMGLSKGAPQTVSNNQ